MNTKKHVWIAVIVFLVARYYLGFFAEFIPVSGEWGTIARFNLGEKELLIEQKIIIVNYPRNIITRKIIIGLYDWLYPLTVEQVREAVERSAIEYERRGGNPEGLYVTDYSRVFFRETDDTPRDWDGKNDPRREGREYLHYQDIIAEIIWKEGEAKAYTTLYEGFDYRK